MSQQKPPRISFYLNEEEQQALNEIKAHYGTQSNSIASRKALVEHAKQLKEPKSEPVKSQHVTYSKRVF